MNIKVFNTKALVVGSLTLPPFIFQAKISDSLIAQAVRVYLANQRKSYAKTKPRSEIRGTTKKMWAQKGTGRARHSSAKAPIFVGGGVAHGPRGNQNYQLKLNKKMRARALQSILSQFAQDKRIIAIQKITSIQPQTRQADKLIGQLRKNDKIMEKSKKIAIITASPAVAVKRAFSNLPYITLLNLKSLSVYQLARQHFLIFSPQAIHALSSKWVTTVPIKSSKNL